MSDLLCHHCSEPIGVYEPLITLVAGVPQETSRAAGLQVYGGFGAACFHRACFEHEPVSSAAQD